MHLLSLLVLKFVFVPRSTLFAYMIFIKNTEINESYKLCQFRDKHTVGGIVFYKHLFLVLFFHGAVLHNRKIALKTKHA